MRFDFVGIGVSRSGTTWTWDRLIEHPNIYGIAKESRIVFANNKEKYNKTFKGHNSKLRGEYCPAYLFTPQKIIKNLKKLTFPPKLIAIFRNPIDRSFSQYKQSQWRKFRAQKESFVDWFENYGDTWIAHPKLALKYAKCLAKFQEKFDVQVKLYDDMVEDPLGYIQEVYDFIGADKDFVPPGLDKKEKKPYNVFWEKNPIEFKKSERNWAVKYYRKSIKEFSEVIGRDLKHWLK